MKPETLALVLIPAAFRLLPERMGSPEAKAMVVAIAMQETELLARKQILDVSKPWWKQVDSPAVSLWQFERLGQDEVLRHHSSRTTALQVLGALGLPDDSDVIREAMVYNDVLAACWARLALWRLPAALPGYHDVETAWLQYMRVWAPGKPHKGRWEWNYRMAWDTVTGES